MSNVLNWRQQLVGAIDGVVLEIGVGSGANLAHYRRAATVFAIEPNHVSAQRAHNTALRCAIPMSVKIAVAEELPFADASVDHVVSSLVFCSVHNQHRALREIRRVLRPSGVLHMLEHVRPTEPLFAAVAATVTPYWSRIAHNCHLDRPTLDVLRTEGWRVHILQRFGVFVRIEARP